MTDIVDDEISAINRKIEQLMQARQERIDHLTNSDRIRILGIYKNMAHLIKELDELKDSPYTPTEVYVGWDEHEYRNFPVSFEGKYFTFDNGTIEEK